MCAREASFPYTATPPSAFATKAPTSSHYTLHLHLRCFMHTPKQIDMKVLCVAVEINILRSDSYNGMGFSQSSRKIPQLERHDFNCIHHHEHSWIHDNVFYFKTKSASNVAVINTVMKSYRTQNTAVSTIALVNFRSISHTAHWYLQYISSFQSHCARAYCALNATRLRPRTVFNLCAFTMHMVITRCLCRTSEWSIQLEHAQCIPVSRSDSLSLSPWELRRSFIVKLGAPMYARWWLVLRAFKQNGTYVAFERVHGEYICIYTCMVLCQRVEILFA